LGINLLAIVRGEAGPDEPMVIGEDLRVGVPRRWSIAVEPSMSVKSNVSVCVANSLGLPSEVDADCVGQKVTDLLKRAADVAYIHRRRADHRRLNPR